MKIVITAPTGHIGRELVRILQQLGGHELVLLARKPEKLKEEQARGARVEQGQLEDASFVQRACQGADALFWLNPPDPSTEDHAGSYRRMTESGAGAAKTSGIKHVVFLSSVGAHLDKGVGPVNALHECEAIMRKAGCPVTILRPAFFMENFLASAEGIAQAQSVFFPISGSARIAMIATRDIAAATAKILAGPAPEGVQILPLHGPKDYSFDEVAAAIGQALGKPIKHVKVSPEQARQAMTGSGMSGHFTDLILELYSAIDGGRIKHEFPRSAKSTTPTTIEQFAKEVFTLAFQATATH